RARPSFVYRCQGYRSRMPLRRTTIQSELMQGRSFSSRREEVLLALLRTGAIARRLPARVVETRGLSLAQYNVLRILRSAGDEGLATLAIRERMIEEAAGITRLIDKLEAAALVRRDRSSDDRRRVVCRITAEGLTTIQQLDDSIIRACEAALEMLDDADMDDLVRLLDLIRSRGRQAGGGGEEELRVG